MYSCTELPVKKKVVVNKEASLPLKVEEEKKRPQNILDECFSVNNIPIEHHEFLSTKENPLKILVISSIHGDEPSATIVAWHWIHRLRDLSPRSSWRIVPLLNPDGHRLKTRTNFNKVDVNRNFPTKDFEKEALKYWREKKKSDPRRFPGFTPASEPETKCVLSQLQDFNPDFVIAIHAPYGILDFDGPLELRPPFIKHLSWKRFGHFPGSLGRYLWHDRGIPVLTIELKSATAVPEAKVLSDLQDMAGSLAIETINHLRKKQKH